MADAEELERAEARGVLTVVTDPVFKGFEMVGSVIALTSETLVWLIRPPYRFGQLLLAMEFIGVQSVFIVALTGVFSGMVLALQTTNSLREFGAEGMVGLITAKSLVEEIAPVFSALMVAARAGSAMAAELGNMRVTEQIDALVTMAVSPVQYLLSPRLLGAVLMTPLLCVLYTCVGMGGAWLVAVHWLGVDPGTFIAKIEQGVVPSDFSMGLIKAAVFGFLISAISCTRGFNATGGARGVGQATTQAVVHSSVSILVANYLLTSLLLQGPAN